MSAVLTVAIYAEILRADDAVAGASIYGENHAVAR
jgi:hypothetical protein